MRNSLFAPLLLLSACGSRTYLDAGETALTSDAATPADGGFHSSKCIPGAAPLAFVSDAVDLVSDGNGTLFVDRQVGDTRGVWPVSTADGSVGPALFVDSDSHFTLALDATYLYWSYGAVHGFGVRRVPRSGGAVETLTTLPDYARGLAVDEHDVYIGLFPQVGDMRGLVRFPKWGGALVVIADAEQFEVRALSSTRIYASDGLWLWSFDKATLVRTRYVAVSYPSRAVLDGDALFVTQGQGVDVSPGVLPKGRVAVLPGGVPPATVLADQQASPSSLAVDDAFVYWLTVGTLTHDDGGTRVDGNGTLRKVPKAGGAPVTLAQTRGDQGSLVVDDECAYWPARGAIMKVRK